MKKYKLIAIAFIFVLGLFAFNINSVNAFPPGCSSTSGYSSINGESCDTTPQPTYPGGCTSTSGWSSTTGLACDGTTYTPPAPTPTPVSTCQSSGYDSATVRYPILKTEFPGNYFNFNSTDFSKQIVSVTFLMQCVFS